MEKLSYEMLVQAYRAALQLNVDDAFLELLKKEMERREKEGPTTHSSFPPAK